MTYPVELYSFVQGYDPSVAFGVIYFDLSLKLYPFLFPWLCSYSSRFYWDKPEALPCWTAFLSLPHHLRRISTQVTATVSLLIRFSPGFLFYGLWWTDSPSLFREVSALLKRKERKKERKVYVEKAMNTEAAENQLHLLWTMCVSYCLR